MVSFFVIFVLLSISSDNHPSVFSNKLVFAKEGEVGDLFRAMGRQNMRLKPALDIIDDEDKVLLFTLIFNLRLSQDFVKWLKDGAPEKKIRVVPHRKQDLVS